MKLQSTGMRLLPRQSVKNNPLEAEGLSSLLNGQEFSYLYKCSLTEYAEGTSLWDEFDLSLSSCHHLIAKLSPFLHLKAI